MTSITVDSLVVDYLRRLDVALSRLPSSRRAHLVTEITEHIDEARTELVDPSEVTIRELLDRIGRPDDIAAEALAEQPDRRPIFRRLVTAGVLVVVTAVGLTAALVFSRTSNGTVATSKPDAVSNASLVLPSTVGMTIASATSELEALDVQVLAVPVTRPGALPGTVVGQVPAGHSIVRRGSVVTVSYVPFPSTATQATGAPSSQQLPTIASTGIAVVNAVPPIRSGIHVGGPLGPPHPTGGGSTATSYLIAQVGSAIYGKHNLTDTWSTLWAGTVTNVVATGTRIAFLDNTDTLWAKDGLAGTWYREIGSVSQYVLTPEYLIARVGDTVYAKAGLTDLWTILTTSATDVRAAGSRIVVLAGNGHLLAKDTIGGVWFDETSGVSQYVVTSSYLIVRQGTTISGKQGLSDAWTTLVAGGATDVQAAGTRIAFLDNTGTVWAKEGLGGTWYQETSPVSQYVVTPDLLLVRAGSTIYGKQNLGDTWVVLTAGTATEVTAAGTRIAFEDGSGTVFAKDGLNSVWYQEIGSASQFVATTTEPQ